MQDELSALKQKREKLLQWQAEKKAEYKSAQDELKRLADIVMVEYGVELKDLEALHLKKLEEYKDKVAAFKRDLERAEAVRQEIETSLTSHHP
jgi:hypothetical protein